MEFVTSNTGIAHVNFLGRGILRINAENYTVCNFAELRVELSRKLHRNFLQIEKEKHPPFSFFAENVPIMHFFG